MRVVDAGVVVDLLAGQLDPDRLSDEEPAAPLLIDSAVTRVLRGLVGRSVLSGAQGALALDGFIALTLTGYPAAWLRPRIWSLRHNLSAYDATYVSLTEMIDATELLTTDARLVKAPGPQCRIRLLHGD